MRRLFKRWSGQAGLSSLIKSSSRPPLAQYNTYDARTLFSQLIRRVRAGEEIVIAHAGIPVAILRPYVGRLPRRPGVIRAHLIIHEEHARGSNAAEVTPTRSSPAASS